MKRIGVLLLSAVVLALGLVAPNTALAADAPVVNWANSDPNDLGVLQVSVTSPQEITHLTAHVLSPSGGAEVAVTDDFVLRSGTATNGVWATRETFKLADLGFYPVDVDATAADGTTVTATSIGHLTYYAQTIFDPLTASRTQVTYAHRDVVLRGRVLTRDPGTREVTPFPGAPISLNWREYGRNGANDDVDWAQLTTGADGRFSYTRTQGGTDDFYANYPYQNEFPGHLSGTSADLRVPVKLSPVRLTATVAPRRLDAGGQITVSGRATWKSPTGWRPLTGAHLIIGPYYPGWTQADTDADGRYSASFTPYQSTDIPLYYVATDPFIDNATRTTKVIVVQPSLISQFTAQRGFEANTVEVSGDLEFPGAGSPYRPTVDIEFSVDGTTWVRKTTLPADAWFNGTVPAKRPGYWRAHYRGGLEFQPSVGEAVYVDPR